MRKDGDLMFFGAGTAKVVNDALGALRVKIGHEKGYAQAGWQPLWVVDFPMFEWDEDAKRWNAMHHPFTAPADGHEDLLDTDPGRARAKAHDMVLNGWELGGGSVRIHTPGRAIESVPRAQHQCRGGARPSSASCCRRCSTARPRTAGSRSGSTAS